MLLTYLRLRTWLGWGRHPDDLRVRARLYASMASRLLPLSLIGIVVIFGFLALLEHSSRRALTLPTLVREAVPLGAFYVLFIVVGMLVPALNSRILAQRAQSTRPAVMFGRCFATIPDVPGPLYACIGLSRERARWYLLPLEWDIFIEPSDTELELTVLEGCGCVERVRRLGPNPRDLRLSDLQAQEGRHMSSAELYPAAPDAVAAAASPQERRSLRRAVRHAGIAARFSSTYILLCGWLTLVFGAVFGPGQVITSATLVVLFPESFRDPGGRVAGLIYLAVVLAVGISCMVYGIHLLRIGRRARTTRHEAPAAVTGEVVSWMPYRDLWTPAAGSSAVRQGRTETAIRVRLPDGTTPIYCIPRAYLHRVRELGAPVRITYLPSTMRVVDARRLEQPGVAPPTA